MSEQPTVPEAKIEEYRRRAIVVVKSKIEAESKGYPNSLIDPPSTTFEDVLRRRLAKSDDLNLVLAVLEGRYDELYAAERERKRILREELKAVSRSLDEDEGSEPSK